MLKGAVINRIVVVCPVCKVESFRVHRRALGTPHGTVVNHCECLRCGTNFCYDEDRLGRPLRR